jgi:hypothetical protein
MKKVVKILTLILAISAACQAVVAYASGNSSNGHESVSRESPGP